MYVSKKSREYILLSTFKYKTAFLAIFRSISVGNRFNFFTVFVQSGRLGDVFKSFDSLTTTPCLGTPPANSRCIKQFLSCPHNL
jgi:hypothetical protein